MSNQQPYYESNTGFFTETSSNECLDKIIKASDLEKSGNSHDAMILYREVLELDQEGTYGAIAVKALKNLEKSAVSTPHTPIRQEELSQVAADVAELVPEPQKGHQSLIGKFENWPLLKKLVATLFASELISMVGLVGVGSLLIISSSRTQLAQKAESELAVTQINYDIKINQMEFGFRGQSDNRAIIEAAKTYGLGQSLNPQLFTSVKEILKNEIQARNIEYVTLVGKDKRIIVNANRNRQGQEFDPNGLVSKVLEKSEQIKSSEIVSRAELKQEQPPLLEGFEDENGLIRYVVTPVIDEGQVIGALVAGDIVNNKFPIVEQTVNSLNGGYSAIYLYQNNKFSLATSLGEGNTNTELLSKALEKPSEVVTGRLNREGKSCSFFPLPWSKPCYYIAAKSLTNTLDEQPVAILVRGTPESSLNALLWNTFGWQLLAFALVLCAGIAMTWFLRGSIVKPLKKLTDVAEDFSAGNREVRAETSSSDEIGLLTATFNEMADNIVASETNLSNLARQQEVEVQKQRQKKERLQQEVIQLLLEIERAQDGDLTVRAKVTDGIVGSIADAFNTTIRKLRQLLLEVEKVSGKVSNQARSGENSVLELSHAAKNQWGEIDRVLNNVEEMNSSISEVANSGALAAKIARRARTEAKIGDNTMDRTVESIEKIRGTVAVGAKKVKQLAESSLEISQIVAIISGISEKTNVLAFNASIEAARAGENGQGFRVVADEVRRLADRVTEATKDIQQLVSRIQEEISAVLQIMEVSTTEVVTGTELVGKTKEILQNLAKTSMEIDHYLQTISQSTTAQTNSSQQVNDSIEEVAAIALTTSTEAEDVVKSLSSLVSESKTLSSSVAQFRLKS